MSGASRPHGHPNTGAAPLDAARGASSGGRKALGPRPLRRDDVLRLKPALDDLYRQHNYADRLTDPIEIARRYPDPADREIAAFCAAGLAFGRVASVMQSVQRLLAAMGPSPAAFICRFDPRRDGPLFDDLGHRWTRGRDLAALVWVLKQMLEARGSIQAFFLDGYDPAAPDIGSALEAFSTAALRLDLRAVYGARRPPPQGVAYFFARPSSGSACKRLNLFLRWMVRSDGVDFGLWPSVSPSKLIIPLDTHIVRLGQCLRLTTYTSPGWRMAAQITASLRVLDPDDPIKYDFSLCHVGMMDACGFRRPYRDERCPLRGSCRPAGARKRRVSPPPSGRR
jgi:uncharacterized protein (TIGR02757 family)